MWEGAGFGDRMAQDECGQICAKWQARQTGQNLPCIMLGRQINLEKDTVMTDVCLYLLIILDQVGVRFTLRKTSASAITTICGAFTQKTY
jgi:hypothetical protein